jgi:hypothetical protein
MAVRAVKEGAGECLVRAVYAPNVAEPLDVQVELCGASREASARKDELDLVGNMPRRRECQSQFDRARSTSAPLVPRATGQAPLLEVSNGP